MRNLQAVKMKVGISVITKQDSAGMFFLGSVPSSLPRLELWRHFAREGEYKSSIQLQAFCNCCTANLAPETGKTPIRGEQKFLMEHLMKCRYVPEVVRAKFRTTRGVKRDLVPSKPWGLSQES